MENITGTAYGRLAIEHGSKEDAAPTSVIDTLANVLLYASSLGYEPYKVDEMIGLVKAQWIFDREGLTRPAR